MKIKCYNMFRLKFLKSAKFSIFLLLILVFTAEILYCQTDSLLIKQKEFEENKFSFEKERFSVGLGLFNSIDDAGITFGSKQLGLGVIIDLEDALGLETSSFVFRGSANFKYGKRFQHDIVFDYFSINRRASKTLEADLEIGDNIYTVGTKLESKFNVSIIKAKYEYAYLQDDRISLGLTAGLFIMPLKFSVISDSLDEQKTSMVAPLPLIGLYSNFLITKKLVLRQRAEMLYLKVDNFTGSILDLNFSVEHKTFKHFGFGLGFNLSRLNITAKGNDYPEINFFGSIRMEYSGALLYVRFYL